MLRDPKPDIGGIIEGDTTRLDYRSGNVECVEGSRVWTPPNKNRIRKGPCTDRSM